MFLQFTTSEKPNWRTTPNKSRAREANFSPFQSLFLSLSSSLDLADWLWLTCSGKACTLHAPHDKSWLIQCIALDIQSVQSNMPFMTQISEVQPTRTDYFSVSVTAMHMYDYGNGDEEWNAIVKAHVEWILFSSAFHGRITYIYTNYDVQMWCTSGLTNRTLWSDDERPK